MLLDNAIGQFDPQDDTIEEVPKMSSHIVVVEMLRFSGEAHLVDLRVVGVFALGEIIWRLKDTQ